MPKETKYGIIWYTAVTLSGRVLYLLFEGRKLMKKIISVILSIAMLLGIAGVSVTAEKSGSDAQLMSENNAPDDLFAGIQDGLSYFVGGINNSVLYLRATDDPDVFEFAIRFEENDGDIQDNGLGIYYNTKTGECYCSDYQKGIWGTGFNYNALTKVFYAMNDCWHKAFGFTPLYDLLAIFAFNYTTDRIFFDYGGKEWMVQLWKGNYIFYLFVGGELGIYNRPENSTIGYKYNCVEDDEILPMSIKVYDKDRVYFDRAATPCWWATGFVFADAVRPKSLTMEASMEFPNEEMCNAFVASAEKENDITLRVEGTTVYLVW